MGQVEEPTELQGDGPGADEEVPIDHNHKWMMVGYWELKHSAIFESFVSGKALHLGEPDNVDGPGCIECGKHWTTGRYLPCEPEETA